jgi:hypothetical protein
MIEENKHIDKLFQEKLGERTFEVPAAFLADLEGKLAAPVVASKRIKGFWFWLSAFAMVGFAAAAYLYHHTEFEAFKGNSVAKSPVYETPLENEYTSSIFIPIKNSNPSKSNDKKNASTPGKLVSVAQYNKNPNAFTRDNQTALTNTQNQANTERKRIQDAISIAELQQQASQRSFTKNDVGGF